MAATGALPGRMHRPGPRGVFSGAAESVRAWPP